MNEDAIEGGVKVGAGKVESLAGRMTSSTSTEARGDARQVEGQVQEAAAKAEDAIGKIADAATAAVAKLSDHATATVSKVSDQARDAYGEVSKRAQKVADTIDPFVQEKPYASLSIGIAAGLVLGLLLAGRGPRVIYVKGSE